MMNRSRVTWALAMAAWVLMVGQERQSAWAGVMLDPASVSLNVNAHGLGDQLNESDPEYSTYTASRQTTFFSDFLGQDVTVASQIDTTFLDDGLEISAQTHNDHGGDEVFTVATFDGAVEFDILADVVVNFSLKTGHGDATFSGPDFSRSTDMIFDEFVVIEETGVALAAGRYSVVFDGFIDRQAGNDVDDFFEFHLAAIPEPSTGLVTLLVLSFGTMITKRGRRIT